MMWLGCPYFQKTKGTLFRHPGNRKKLRPFIAWLWAASLFVVPGVAFGVEIEWAGWILDPTFSISEELNDNPRLAFAREDPGFVTTFSPGFLLRRHTERWRANLAARLDYTMYTGTEISDIDAQRVELGSLYHLNERNLLQFNVGYKRDTLLRRILIDFDEDFVAQGDLQDIDSGIVGINIRRNRLNLAPSWRYDLTERTKVQLLYDFIDQSYGESEQLNLLGVRRHKVVGSALYYLAPLKTVSLDLDTSRITAENDNQTDTVALLAGLSYPFFERLTSEARAGYRISSTDRDGESIGSSGFVGELTLRYYTETSEFSGTVGRLVTPSGRGQANETDRIRFQYTRALRPRLSFALGVDMFSTQAIADDSSRKRRFFDVRPRLVWHWTQWWAVEGGYHYRRRELNDDNSDRTSDSNAVFIALTYSPPPVGR